VKQKQPVGERLALVARTLVYGERIVSSGPVFSRMQIDGQRAILHFRYTGSGLATRRMVLEDVVRDGRTGQVGGALHVAPSEASPGVPLVGFTIAGEDRKFVKAEAVIDHDTVIVQSPLIVQPRAVRYGWADYPTGNLFNAEGLPASPFRTDDWTKAE
jgi:sialate O-acetylesterase